MQHPTSDLITPFELGVIDSFDEALVGDEDLRVEVDFRHRTATSYDASTGTPSVTEEEATDVPAIRGVVSADRAGIAEGELEVGDRIYLIRPSDLSDRGITLPPNREDVIREGGVDRKVIRWSRDEEVGDVYRFVARES